MKQLTELLAKLKDKYAQLEREYIDECAIDFMSRRATYLDGQLATLYEIGLMVEDALEEEQNEIVNDYDPADFDFELDDDVDETNYDPYCGCEYWCD